MSGLEKMMSGPQLDAVEMPEELDEAEGTQEVDMDAFRKKLIRQSRCKFWPCSSLLIAS